MFTLIIGLAVGYYVKATKADEKVVKAVKQIGHK